MQKEYPLVYFQTGDGLTTLTAVQGGESRWPENQKCYELRLVHKIEQLIHYEAVQLDGNNRFYITFIYGHN